MMRTVLYLIGVLILISVIGRALGREGSPATSSYLDTVVMVTRDSNELRFMNEGPANLIDCDVIIDGNFSAALRSLPAGTRGFLMRAQFAAEMPTDEFYSRSLRSTRIECRDGDSVRLVRLK